MVSALEFFGDSYLVSAFLVVLPFDPPLTERVVLPFAAVGPCF